MSTDSTNAQFEEKINKTVTLHPPDRAALHRLTESSANDWGNASEVLRGLIREADEQADPEGGPAKPVGREPPTEDDLEDAWEALLRLTNGGKKWVSRDRASSYVSQRCSISKGEVYASLLRPLAERGYLKISTDPAGRTSSVFVWR